MNKDKGKMYNASPAHGHGAYLSYVASLWHLASMMPALHVQSLSSHTASNYAARAWNTLTPSVQSSESLPIFRRRLNCSRAPSQINCFSERSVLRDSVYFTTLKSLDYNVVMTFRFNNNNNMLFRDIDRHVSTSWPRLLVEWLRVKPVTCVTLKS